MLHSQSKISKKLKSILYFVFNNITTRQEASRIFVGESKSKIIMEGQKIFLLALIIIKE